MGKSIISNEVSHVEKKIFLAPSYLINANAKVSSSSVFSDSTWNMSSLVTLPGVKKNHKFFDFSTIPGFPAGFSLSLAEYAYARLYSPAETHGRECEWLTIYNELLGLREFAIFCSSQFLSNFDELDNSTFEKYLHKILFSTDGNEKSDERAKVLVGWIYRLWEYRKNTSKPIKSIPFGKPLNKLFKSKKDDESALENKTPIIPDVIYSALIGAALDYVLIYSEQITDVWLRMQKYWDEELLSSSISYSKKIKFLDKFSTDLLLTVKSPWRKKEWCTYGNVYTELHRLRAACIIVILAFSGIRASELLSIESGCCISDLMSDGKIRYYLNTILHKHRGSGSKDAWVIIEEVSRAVVLLELLTKRARLSSMDSRLMITDGSGAFFSVQKQFVKSNIKEYTNEAISNQLNVFSSHCNDVLNRKPIPKWSDDKGVLIPWNFSMRQFRRTLARHIVRQPFGVIAGMLQYKHVDVTIFEGYAGCEPEWNKLLSDERVLASIDILEEISIDLSQGAVAGEFGLKLKNEFEIEFKGRAEDFPPSQILKWLKNSKKDLLVGKFNFCFFDPNKAMCTHDRKDKNTPVLNFCQPEFCDNACVSKRHAPLWIAQLNQAEELIALSKGSEFGRIALEAEVAKLKKVVSNFK